MKIYAATPIDGLTEDQRSEMVRLVDQWLEESYPNAEIYFPLRHYEAHKEILDNERDGPKIVCEQDLNHLEKSNVIVGFQPGLSGGVHFELGFALANELTIRVVEFLEFDVGEKSLMLSKFEVEGQFPW